MGSDTIAFITTRVGRCVHRPYVLLLLVLFAAGVSGQINPARDLVNPFIGTGGHGHTFPGACVPNGLVQVSPDTRTDGVMDWDGCGGYHHSDSLIYGFSHTHLSGTGVADLCDVLLMPMSGAEGEWFLRYGYRQLFDHEQEQAHAGYYKVQLKGTPSGAPASFATSRAPLKATVGERDIDVELTATKRVGVHRYSFQPGQTAQVVLDLFHRDELLAGSINTSSATEVVGERRSSSWARDQRLYFCIRFSAPIVKEHVMPSNIVGKVAAYDFGPLERPLIVKVGISAVSIEGARANLNAEVPHWDFDRVRQEAEDAWNTKLNKIQIEGGTREQQRIFYTALYHCYVAPYIFNDVDGNYRGMSRSTAGGDVHHADHNVYTVFSLWDTFRALHPLMTILEPEMTSDWIKTFLLHYQQSGRLPVWELWGNETDCMIGYHSASVIADAYMKGIRGFDARLALEAMVSSAMRDEPGLNAYRTKGFMSSEDQSESVSKTLEYAYDDGCIAQYRSDLGVGGWDTIAMFGERARNHTNLFGPGTGFYRARRNGGFIAPFDPYEVNFHFTEANAWQYGFFAPQDLGGMMVLYGGPKGLEMQLDKLFAATSGTSGRDQADITGLIGQYAHGNEPSHHMAYLYNTVGKPEKTRELVRRILTEQYHDAPDGLSGNEDCGQMSAWYVLSALGLYPISPGINDRYELGYPLFSNAQIGLPNGKTWNMTVDQGQERSPKPPMSGDGHVPLSVRHKDLLSGGGLTFDQERKPHPVPHPSEAEIQIVDDIDPCARRGAPYIEAPSTAFRGILEIVAHGCGDCMVRENGIDRPCIMEEPFTIEASATVTINWHPELQPVVAQFTRMDDAVSIDLASTFAAQYAAGGEQALVDGLRGGVDFRTGEWQGFHGQDLLATIDLGSIRTVTRIGLSVLQDQRSWIWLPQDVQFAFSSNGRKWSTATITHNIPMDTAEPITLEMMTTRLAKKARYIKVIARGVGPCPEWHAGKGGDTWIFADEVLIETE